MAIMYPRRLKADSVQSQAEVVLYTAFQQHLDDNFTVYHSRAFLDSRAKSLAEREIDFIIAHPNHGLLFIEAKGGMIGYSGDTGEWLQNSKAMKKSPVQQISSAMHGLIDYLRRDPLTSRLQIPFGYALAFPDVQVATVGNVGAEIRRELIIDRDMLRNTDALPSAILSMMKHWQGNRPAPSKGALETLKKVLAPSFFLTSYLSANFEDEAEQIKELTDEQYEVLNERLEDAHRYLITGVAGSGKTMLAIRKAQQLTEQGKQVLYVCYNNNLSTSLQSLKNEQLHIFTFHRLCYFLFKQAAIGYPENDNSQNFFSYVLPGILGDSLDKITTRYDAIIVDEGQDFRRTYWQPLMGLLRDPQASALFIFCDDGQRIYSQDALPFTTPTYHLKKNLRNVLPIGEVAQTYRHVEDGRLTYVAAGPDSARPIEEIDLIAFDSPQAALAQVLADLESERVRLEEVILLTTRNSESMWRDNMQVGRYLLRRDINARGKGVLAVQTIQSFKGLERPVVILAELDRVSPEMQDTVDQLLYVALSRARNHLIVLGKLPVPQG